MSDTNALDINKWFKFKFMLDHAILNVNFEFFFLNSFGFVSN